MKKYRDEFLGKTFQGFLFFFWYAYITYYFNTLLYTQKLKVVLEEKVHIMLNNMIF